MRYCIRPLIVIAATLGFASASTAQQTIVIQGIFDSTSGQVLWRWTDPAGSPHDSGQALGTANEVDPAQRLVGRLVVPVKNGDKVRFEVEGVAQHGVIFENGKQETAGATPVWSRLAGKDLKDLPSVPQFNHYDRANANTTDPVQKGEIIEIQINNLAEDQPIFFSCRVHSLSGARAMFGALVLSTERNLVAAKRLVATSRMVSTGTSNRLSFDEALQDAVAKLPPIAFPDGLRTFSVVGTEGTVGGIAGLKILRVTIIAQDQPGHEAPMSGGHSQPAENSE